MEGAQKVFHELIRKTYFIWKTFYSEMCVMCRNHREISIRKPKFGFHYENMPIQVY